MARLPLVDPAAATGSNKQVFDALQKRLGVVPNMTRAMANAPSVLHGYASFSGALAGGRLPAGLREEIALLSAEVNACEYCLSAHSAIGAMVGLSAAQQGEARRGSGPDSKSTAALRFAKAVIDAKGGVNADDVKAVRAAGYTDAEIAEIVAEVALNYFTNVFNRAFEVDVDFPRVAPLAEQRRAVSV